jgi:nucleotide-binding universal stress UspA family protein
VTEGTNRPPRDPPRDRAAELSDYALRTACSLARDYDAYLIVLHFLERALLIYTGVMTALPSPPPSAEEREAVQNKLHRTEPTDPTIRVEHLLEEGDPATAILQVAQEGHCDLIDLGTHGRGEFVLPSRPDAPFQGDVGHPLDGHE